MGFLSSLAPKQRTVRTAFPGASVGRLTASWTTDPGAINRWLRYELVRLRARSRQLARADAYGARFIKACVDNVAGPCPFELQSKAKTSRGGFNTTANANIEEAWEERSRPKNYDVTGKLSRASFIRLMVKCIARDGEVVVRRHRGPDFKGLQLQIIDIDRLDECFNTDLPDGGSIKLGVELDKFSRPVAYHLLKEHPGEQGLWGSQYNRDHERVPAGDIDHLFVADWPEQVRGFPWIHAAMVRLHHLGGFEEAAVINARIGAAKVAVIQGQESINVAAAQATGKDAQGNLLTDVEPGSYWTLPEGTTLGSFMPAFPDTSVEPFIKAVLRGAAAACGMAYHSFANDPGEVNYSTARVALLDERDGWAGIQNWFVEHFCEPDAEDWMRSAVIMGQLPQAYLPYKNSLYFQPRTWQWIDPEKEVNAEVTALDKNLKSRTQIIRERGGDIEDTFDEIAAENELAKEKKIDLISPKDKPPAPPPKPAEPVAPQKDVTVNVHNTIPERDVTIENNIQPQPITIPAPVINQGDVHVAGPEIRTGDNIIQVPEQRSPDVNVNVAPTEVTLGDTHISVPEQKAPDVNVTVEAPVVNIPEQKSPEVNVTVEPAQITNNVDVPVPQVTVHQARTEDTEEIIERDEEREIERITRRVIRDKEQTR